MQSYPDRETLGRGLGGSAPPWLDTYIDDRDVLEDDEVLAIAALALKTVLFESLRQVVAEGGTVLPETFAKVENMSWGMCLDMACGAATGGGVGALIWHASERAREELDPVT